ncbi:uncharacterized protein LOC134541348 [Bacillus rossius redtenbacheri]|uniref:uncharacterized protein LOC134541348 n=1 Tax=Bacillus rossius redtenbacheri TaxID=93214 RepID=UPI002FDCC554
MLSYFLMGEFFMAAGGPQGSDGAAPLMGRRGTAEKITMTVPRRRGFPQCYQSMWRPQGHLSGPPAASSSSGCPSSTVECTDWRYVGNDGGKCGSSDRAGGGGAEVPSCPIESGGAWHEGGRGEGEYQGNMSAERNGRGRSEFSGQLGQDGAGLGADGFQVRKKSERSVEGDPKIAEADAVRKELGVELGESACKVASEQPLGDGGGEETGIVGVLHQVGPRWGLQVGNVEGEQERRENGALGDAGENGPGCGKRPLNSNPEGATPQERAEETDQVQEHHARLLPPGEPLHHQELHTSNGVGGGMTGAETELVMGEQVKGVDLKKKAPVDDSLCDLGEDGEKRDRTNGGGYGVGAGGRTELETGEQRGDFRRCDKREGQGIREERESDVTGQGRRSIIIVRGLRRQGGVGAEAKVVAR